MPTAAKLVAALCLAALGYATSELIKTILPASIDYGMFSIVNLVIGLVIGWIVVGNRAGRGYAAAISNGFTGTIFLVFWGLFVQGVVEMTQLSMRHRYDGPFEAVVAIFDLMSDYGQQILDVRVIALVLCGGILTGLLAEAAAQRWR